MKFNTTDDRIYLVETAYPFQRVAFQFMPEDLSWNRAAKIQSIAVVGRNNDLYQYTGGTDTMKFTVDFFSDTKSRRDVIAKVDFIKSLAMSDGGFGPARNVKLIMGQLTRKEVWIVSSVDVKMSNFDITHNYLPIRATVSIKLILDPNKNRRIQDVRR